MRGRIYLGLAQETNLPLVANRWLAAGVGEAHFSLWGLYFLSLTKFVFIAEFLIFLA